MNKVLKRRLGHLFSLNAPIYLLYVLLQRTKLANYLSDETFTKLQYRAVFAKKLNLKDPQTFNEKLQWLKLYDHQEVYTTLVDKYLVKDYVAMIIGKEYVIPTLGVWDRFEDIDFEKLPNQFVLKTNHSGGNTGVVICKDKTSFNKEDARRKLTKSLQTSLYLVSREWPYKAVKRKIIAENYMEDKITGELRDYKFFCFNGEPKALFVASGRQDHDEPYFDFFDQDYNHLDLRCSHPQADELPEKPQSFDQMIELAKLLSKNLPEIRVDLYEINGKPYFGELTLYHWGGLMPFYPESWDKKFGEWINLPK